MKYEDQDLPEEKKEAAMNWFKTICDPNFQLIDGLVSMYIDNVTDAEMTRKIMKILRKLNYYLPDMVGHQFFNNMNFPPALVKYLEIKASGIPCCGNRETNTSLKSVTTKAFIHPSNCKLQNRIH